MLVNTTRNRQTYLRVSLTDRCNLACRYCMPAEGFQRVARDEILTPEEIGILADLFVRSGVTKIRLTGGEPLIRGGLEIILASLAPLTDKATLAITTNGLLLSQWLNRLIDGGISRINVSLDTLRGDRFRQITGVDGLSRVLTGIEQAAEQPAISQLKINVVLQRGVNDDEIGAFMQLADRYDIDVRFIELMPVEGVPWQFDRTVTKADILNRHPELREADESPSRSDDGPAEYYLKPGHRGRLGFISSLTHPACNHCNRLRLTARGALLRCLYDTGGLDLRQQVRLGASFEELQSSIKAFVQGKTPDHQSTELTERVLQHTPCLASVGG
ncbi:GTP 3',8-cyclase MoaA [bacterium]|nr:GTP 3',8-cyclase MoaA [bacterium]MBU1651217.1 GTP 3',8-cyclase MoaA [bacterium]